MQQHVSRLCPKDRILAGDAYYIEPSITANICEHSVSRGVASVQAASDVIIPPDKDVTLPSTEHGTVDSANAAAATEPEPDAILPSPIVLPDSAVHVTADGRYGETTDYETFDAMIGAPIKPTHIDIGASSTDASTQHTPKRATRANGRSS